MNLLRIFSLLFLSFFIVGCATQVPPSGGAKDTSPPIPVSFHPKNNSLNMASKSKISIGFDEYVTLSNLNSQFIVSPPLNTLPDVKVKGKGVIITLPDSLAQNTTYNLFFGDAIVNFKESLPINNFNYAFSTGDVLDSLTLSGFVKNARDNKPVENTFVILYKDTTAHPGKSIKPYYLAKTKKDGSWQMNNLAAGKYQVFALKDLNSNYLYDQAEEEIAFLDSFVEPFSIKIYADSVPDSLREKPKPINLYLFKEAAKKQAISSSGSISNLQIINTFRQPTQSIELKPLFVDSMHFTYFNKPNASGDTVYTWLKNLEIDTAIFQVIDAGTIIDTARFYFTKLRKNRDSSEFRVFNAKLLSDGQNDFFKPLMLSFPFPISQCKAEQIKLIKITDKTSDTLAAKVLFIDSFPFSYLAIKNKLEEKTAYQIYAPSQTFENIYDKYSDTLKLNFVTTEARNYGSLKLVVQNNQKKPLVIQILTPEDKVVYQHSVLSDTTIKYQYLRPGAYKLKAIYDTNLSGDWSTGDYSLDLLPEHVFYLPSAINIRANWDIDWNWILE